MLEIFQKNERKIGVGILIILLSIIFIALLKQCKEQPSKENKKIISKEQKIIDSLKRENRLLENKNEFLGSQIVNREKDIKSLIINYQLKKQSSIKTKQEYLSRNTTLVRDTTCEKYVNSLEEENNACDSLIKTQTEQIIDLKNRDTIKSVLLDNTKRIVESKDKQISAYKSEIKKRSKLFSVTVGPGVTYTTDKEIKAGGQVTVGLKVIEF